jgi:hypothetical protein
MDHFPHGRPACAQAAAGSQPTATAPEPRGAYSVGHARCRRALSGPHGAGGFPLPEDVPVTVLIDRPNWPGPRGLLWSHLVSDDSYEELHAFARRLGVPERAFDRDHYDVPETVYDLAVRLGAEPVTSRELLHRLKASGLRRPKRRPAA